MKQVLDRRQFMKIATRAGGGLVLAVFLDACAAQTQTTGPDIAPNAEPEEPTAAAGMPAGTQETAGPFLWEPNIFIKIDQDGLLTFTAFRSEMGQGIRTALAMLVAEEADVKWEQVRIEQAPADNRYGDQVTGGSVSISGSYALLRSVGAATRQMLVQAAAQRWGVAAEECSTEPGQVIHPDGTQTIAYGELVEEAAQLEVPRNVKLKDAGVQRIVGAGMHHWDAPQIVTGKAVYGLDVRVPGMVYAAVARCPVFDGTFEQYDEAAALAVPGVLRVVGLQDRVAVVAENSWAAIRGRNALRVTWREGRNASLGSEMLFEAARGRVKQAGSAESGAIDAVYETPYEAHATMEPMNCTAWIHDGLCEVWAPTQSPQAVQSAVFQAVRMTTKVNVTLIGGGFGRRLQTDYAEEAAQLAQETNLPVQVVWTRDDDLQHDFYHPLAVQYLSSPLAEPGLPRAQGANGTNVPTGAWRSVEEFTRAYGRECFIDEMAAAMGRDPYDLRLELYQTNEAALGVIRLAAEKAGWGSPTAAGQGRGMAYHATFGVTHVCHVAEVRVDGDGTVRVLRVVCAVDCGVPVNPDNIAAQMEGGIVFGLTAALKAEATLQDGRIQQSNFHDYPILRMDEMPVVEVYIVPGDRSPSGIGEMGVPPIAPAVANAVFAATGKRVRHIPIRQADLV